MAKKRNIKDFGPVITIIILTAIISVVSVIFSLLGITGNQTSIARGTLETSLVTTNNIFTKAGIRYVITNVVLNLQNFKPLYLLILSLITVSIGEASGLFRAVFVKFKKLSPKFLTFLVLLIGMVSSFFGDYSYVFLLPIVAVVYKEIDKKPLLGILTIFIGITIGYGSGLVYNNEEILLGELTQKATRVDIDSTYIYPLLSNTYVSIAMTVLLSLIGTSIIHNVLDKKIPKSNYDDEIIYNYSKKGIRRSAIAFAIMMVALIYMIIPGLPGSGLLLGEGASYVERLMGESSPFYQGFTFIVLVIMLICGGIYGYTSGNIKDSTAFSVAMSRNFEGLGYVFVLLFFTSQMIGILEWTNIGEVITVKLTSLIGSLSFAGLPLILLFFLVVIITTLLIPSSITKWKIMSPIIVPIMTRANITPHFAQFIFRAADGIGKALTPFFAYYVVTLALLEKYNTKENNKITVFGTLKLMLPTVLLFALVVALVVIGWYLGGLHTGPGSYPTF